MGATELNLYTGLETYIGKNIPEKFREELKSLFSHIPEEYYTHLTRGEKANLERLQVLPFNNEIKELLKRAILQQNYSIENACRAIGFNSYFLGSYPPRILRAEVFEKLLDLPKNSVKSARAETNLKKLCLRQLSDRLSGHINDASELPEYKKLRSYLKETTVFVTKAIIKDVYDILKESNLTQIGWSIMSGYCEDVSKAWLGHNTPKNTKTIPVKALSVLVNLYENIGRLQE